MYKTANCVVENRQSLTQKKNKACVYLRKLKKQQKCVRLLFKGEPKKQTLLFLIQIVSFWEVEKKQLLYVLYKVTRTPNFWAAPQKKGL